MHPITTRLQPSSEQAPAVLAQGCDVVVVAGAGTGKTRTLVARMLHLLATGVELRRIVAVTFTIKAAREMRNRLREEIRHYLAGPALPPAERRFWQEVDAGLDAARIGTLHGLCTELLRNHPAEARIDPAFGVLDEAQAALLLEDAIREALGWAADDAQAVQLFRLFAPSALRALLEQLLRNRLAAAPLLTGAPWDNWPQVLGDLLRRRALLAPAMQEIMADFAALRSDGVLARAAGRGDDFASALLQLLDWYAEHAAQTHCPTYDELAQLCKQLAHLREVVRGQPGKTALWKPTAPPRDVAKRLREHYDNTIAPLLKEVDPLRDGELAGLMPQLSRLFAFALARYTAAKRERGMLDFDDLEQKALDLLQTFPNVRARWQGEISALLVDEFQDTNARQRDLVRCLNGDGSHSDGSHGDGSHGDGSPGAGGRLFLVGDAKQSIYRFRGADVQVFRSEQARLAGGGGRSYDLTVSYRTHAPLLAALNHLLAAILGAQDDPQQPWRAPFQPLQPARPACGCGLAAPHIEVQLAAGTKGGGALARAAAALAARLAQLVAESQAAGGNLTYGDIAILCRSYRGFGPYEDALEAAGIPYMTVAGRGFYTRPEIRDLRNALAALADPSDDLALAGLLRSPAIGLSDVELFHLRCAADGSVRPLWPALQAAADERSRTATALIASLHAAAGRIGVADLLKRLLDATDYIPKLLLAGQVRAARNVAKLLDDAAASGLVSAGAFLEYAAHVNDIGGREGEARPDDTGAVQIMTVHQAKGLQFPVVVIGDAAGGSGKGGGAGRSGVVLFDAQLGVAPVLSSAAGPRPLVCRLADAGEKMMAQAESDRLLYVAATRAADKLIVNGHVKAKPGGELTADGWLGQVLQALQIDQTPAGYDMEGDRAHQFAATLGAERVQCSLYEPQCSDLPLVARAMAAADPSDGSDLLLEPLLLPLPDAALPVQDDERRVWRVVPDTQRAYAPAWVVGRLVHETIAAWRFPLGPDFAQWAAARCRDLGLTDEARLRNAAQRARHLLQRFAADPIFRTVAAADQRLHEIPYSHLVNGVSESGSIDLLYRSGDCWTVLDFKTDRIRTPDQREQIIRAQGYDQQIARYAAAVAQLIGRQPEAYLCLLDDADQVRLWPDPTPTAQ